MTTFSLESLSSPEVETEAALIPKASKPFFGRTGLPWLRMRDMVAPDGRDGRETLVLGSSKDDVLTTEVGELSAMLEAMEILDGEFASEAVAAVGAGLRVAVGAGFRVAGLFLTQLGFLAAVCLAAFFGAMIDFMRAWSVQPFQSRTKAM